MSFLYRTSGDQVFFIFIVLQIAHAMYIRLSVISPFAWYVAPNPWTDVYSLFIWEKIFFDFFGYDLPVPVFKKHCYFSIMSIVTRLALPKKHSRIWFSMFEFSAGSIRIVRRYIYIDLSLKFLFLGLFTIFWLPFISYPILSLDSDSKRNFTRDIKSWKFFLIFLFQRIKIEKISENDVKFCIKNWLFLRLFNFNLYQTFSKIVQNGC